MGVIRKHKTVSGLIKSQPKGEPSDWVAAAKTIVSAEKADVIVHRVVPSHTDAREARHKLGLSQREFASLVGAAVGTVRKWELGTRRPS